MSLTRAVSPVLVALASLAFAAPAEAKTDTYTFRNTLQSTEGGAAGNTLTPVYNGAGEIVASPAGTFVDTKIDAYACPNSPTVRGYAFPAQGGLKSLNSAPIVATGSYTISMIVKFHVLRGGYTRLIDFSDSTLDTGIYVLHGAVNLYNSATFAAGTFVDDRFSVLTLTRDAATNVVTAYVGTTQVGQYIDASKIYATGITTTDLLFFMDNTTGSASIGESSPGVVTLIRVTDTPIAPADLPSIVDRACASAACGNGQIEAGEGCDDGNNVDGDGCSSTCKIENSHACTTVTSVDAGADAGDAGTIGPENASCASNVCDTDTKCGYANGAGSTCTAATANVVCRSSTCGAVSNKCVAEGGCFVDGDCTSGGSCTVATGRCGAVDAGAPSDAGTISFGDSGLSIVGTGASADGGCSLTEGTSRSGMSAMFVVGIGAVIASLRRRRR